MNKKLRLENIPITLLKPHEEIIQDYADSLTLTIQNDGFIYKPILVDENSLVILDGHHRFYAAKKLGLLSIPCILIDYTDESLVTLAFWKKNTLLTKQDVIEAGITNSKYSPKTTRHIVHLPIGNEPINLSLLR